MTTIYSWVTAPLRRHFAAAAPQRSGGYTVAAALNERFSFQLAVRQDGPDIFRAGPAGVALTVEAPRGWSARIRRVGHVPVRHRNTEASRAETDGFDNYPGFVPDPLFDESRLTLPPAETQAFYITVQPGRAAHPGRYAVKLTLRGEKENPAGRGAPETLATHRVSVILHDVVIQPRREFSVTNWFYNDALLDFYNCRGFDRRYWEVLPNYFRDMAAHGQDTVYVPAFTPPLDGVKRPTQLLRVRKVGRERYDFDWRDLRRYIVLARRCGIKKFEWNHLFTQWGAERAIRIYENQGAEEKLLWEPRTAATARAYRVFLAQYLPRLERFLKVEGLAANSFFHVSDEPHGAQHKQNYIQARQMLRQLAPWMRVMDALSEIDYGREKLTDMPVPTIQRALDFIKAGLPCWCYYCCGPRGRFLQRLLDTPLAKIRMNGWLFYRWPFSGFLHWGYNYWYQQGTRVMIDPFLEQDARGWAGWAYGDPFLVYPGADGPIDSLRWEAFADSLQDYALLETLVVARDDRRLAPLRSFEDFPKTEAWLAKTRRALLAGAVL